MLTNTGFNKKVVNSFSAHRNCVSNE